MSSLFVETVPPYLVPKELNIRNATARQRSPGFDRIEIFMELYIIAVLMAPARQPSLGNSSPTTRIARTSSMPT
jgi:hypothetical protein